MKTNKNNIFRYSLYGNPDSETESIHWVYCPIKFDKYITICVDNSYGFWPEVVEIIAPILTREGISVVCFSAEKGAGLGVSLNINGIKVRQAADLMRKSLLNVSGQDWSLTLCQNNGYRNVFALTSKEELLFREEFGEIIKELEKPELLAKQILKDLNIEQDVKINTKFIGPSYGPSIIELVPDFDIVEAPNMAPGTLLGIRCDLVENWEFVFKCICLGMHPVIISRTLPPLPIASMLVGVKAINLYVTEKTTEEEIKKVRSLGIRVKLLSYGESSENIKRNLFNCEDIFVMENWGKNNLDKLKDLNYDTKIRSKKLLASKGKTYASTFHWKNGIPNTERKGNLCLDGPQDDDFLLESDLFYYYEN